MTYQTDFHINYKKYDYENVYDHILMPSRNIADFYNLHTEKTYILELQNMMYN